MLKYLKKDLILNYKSFLINIAILFAFGIYVFLSNGFLDIYFFLSLVFIVLISISPVILDDKLKADALTVSLPIKRTTIVNLRYSVSLVTTVVLIAIIFIYGLILNKLVPAKNFDFSNEISFGTALSIFFIAVIGISILMPFAFKFGQMGIVIGGAALVLLQVIGFAATFFVPKSEGLKITLGMFMGKLESGGLSDIFSSISGRIGAPLSIVLMVAIMGIITFISLKISVLIYNRKEF